MDPIMQMRYPAAQADVALRSCDWRKRVDDDPAAEYKCFRFV